MQYVENLSLIPVSAWYMLFTCFIGLALASTDQEDVAKRLSWLFLFVTTFSLAFLLGSETYRMERLYHPFGLILAVPFAGFFVTWCLFVACFIREEPQEKQTTPITNTN